MISFTQILLLSRGQRQLCFLRSSRILLAIPSAYSLASVDLAVHDSHLHIPLASLSFWESPNFSYENVKAWAQPFKARAERDT